MDKEGIVGGVVDASSQAAGSLVGAGIGTAIAGPIGAIGGAAAGSIVSSIFGKVGEEIKKRFLSPKEEARIETVLTLSCEYVKEKLDQGDRLRDDDFFRPADKSDRPAAEEILEGVLLVSQREYEEKKLPYLAKLYANIAFEKSISRAMADRLLKIAEELTYRQLAAICVVARLQMQASFLDTRRATAFGSVEGAENVAIASDIADLYRRNILHSDEVFFDAAGINPSKLRVAGYGAHLYNLMELATMELDDEALEIMAFLNDTPRA